MHYEHWLSMGNGHCHDYALGGSWSIFPFILLLFRHISVLIWSFSNCLNMCAIHFWATYVASSYRLMGILCGNPGDASKGSTANYLTISRLTWRFSEIHIFQCCWPVYWWITVYNCRNHPVYHQSAAWHFCFDHGFAANAYTSCFFQKTLRCWQRAFSNTGNVDENLKENLSSFFTIITFRIEKRPGRNYVKEVHTVENARKKFRVLKAFTKYTVFFHWKYYVSWYFPCRSSAFYKRHRICWRYCCGVTAYGLYCISLSKSEFEHSWNQVGFWGQQSNTKENAEFRCSRRTIEKTNFESRIVISNLSFQYEEQKVLSGVYATFHKGKKYLITGKSGSGKSTLLNLIAGLYDNYTAPSRCNCEVRDLNKRPGKFSRLYCSGAVFVRRHTLWEHLPVCQKQAKQKLIMYWNRSVWAFLQKQPLGLDTNIGETVSSCQVERSNGLPLPERWSKQLP